ncbi:U1 snRNA associated protein, putative [Plasmodium malariae]|uniref:U1 snRNA associated protein, putative n=1 Tax=Plasmodium malariae TaxID=5858 RepID=A0A1C3L1J1_PLAMA|nr:U1 snRNA associated protein, putative [Plasmodium malariae]SBT80410.1 U1 snRNA associated protein, putative [Plasmodium malariae]SCO94046.1 U1 snRNA associated protein, putative [Plasmodium malariae]
MEEMRSLLDSLMGKDRNETDSKKKHTFKDENVCKYYLIDFCPHDLFPNTKSDIGRCKNIHSEVLKEQLENDENYKYYLAKYQQKFMKKIVEMADIKIQRSREKLKQLSENSKNPLDKKEKIESINSHICDLLKQAEEAGEKGDLVKGTSFNNQITTLQAEIKRLNEEPDQTSETNLKVCEVCGAMKSIGDLIQRFENHVNGKQHLGFEKIRNTLSKLKNELKEREKIIEEHRKTKHSNENNHSKREKSYREHEHKRRSSNHRKSSKRHRSHDKSSRTHHSIRSKRSRKHSSTHRSKSNSTSHSSDRHKERSNRYN